MQESWGLSVQELRRTPLGEKYNTKSWTKGEKKSELGYGRSEDVQISRWSCFIAVQCVDYSSGHR